MSVLEFVTELILLTLLVAIDALILGLLLFALFFTFFVVSVGVDDLLLGCRLGLLA